MKREGAAFAFMVLVIDKSESMSGNPIALAREASKSAVELLSDRAQRVSSPSMVFQNRYRNHQCHQ